MNPAEAKAQTQPIDVPSLREADKEPEGIISPLLDPFSTDLMVFWADMLNDIEKARIMSTNRYGTYTSTDEKKGGHGLPKSLPSMKAIAAYNKDFKRFENFAVRELTRTMKDHPLYDWIMETHGLGLKSTARYLASVGGDPAWNNTEGRLRTVRELWSYSGLAVVDGAAPTRRRGTKLKWKTNARMRAWNIAEPIVKAGGPYRAYYDEARSKYDDAVHDRKCVRCGPSGNPALEGSPLSPGHQHARGIRAVMKAVTKDMWRLSVDKHKELA